jgi:hypothetical protein
MHQWFFFPPDILFSFGTKVWRNVISKKISISWKKKFQILYEKIKLKNTLLCMPQPSRPFFFLKFPILQYLHKWKAKAMKSYHLSLFE